MPQTKNKLEILKRLQTERKRLEQNLAALSPEDMLLPGVVGGWTVKDVLAHLADWQARMPVWLGAARRGEPDESPAPGLTWRQVDILNQRIYETHRDQPLDEVLTYFRATHQQFITMVESMPEDEIMTPGRYPFTGKNAVYNWLGGYAAHDIWGKTQIRKWMKAQQRSSKLSD